MAAVGKSLVFYFQYWTEMQRLYEGEGELEGLEEPEKTREMAREVGVKASSQAADFLEACAPGLEEHFKSIGRCLRKTSRGIAERNWSLEFSIWPKNRNKPVKPKLMAGITIDRLDRAEVIPWIWRLGKQEAEEKLEYTLGQKAKVRSQDLAGWGPGTIGLDRFPIVPDGATGFDLDRDALVDQVQRAFRVFSHQDLEALWPK